MLWTPYANNAERHPVFVRETRRARWAWQREAFRRRSLRVVLRTFGVMIALWVGLSLLWYAESSRSYSYLGYVPDYVFYNAGSSAMSTLFVLVILINVVLDSHSIRISLDSISGEITAGRWDLLRLTSLSERGIVQAKYAVAQLRGWRFTTTIMSARAALVTISLFHAFVLPSFIYGYGYGNPSQGLFYSLVNDPITTVILIGVFVLVTVIFVIEPLWRMKAVTAVGMVISSYSMNTALAALAGLGVIFAVWISQIIIFAPVSTGMSFLFSTLLLASYSVSNVVAALFTVLIVTVIALTIYGYYYLLRTWALRRVTQRIRKSK
jgi:hypothetical protein